MNFSHTTVLLDHPHLPKSAIDLSKMIDYQDFPERNLTIFTKYTLKKKFRSMVITKNASDLEISDSSIWILKDHPHLDVSHIDIRKGMTFAHFPENKIVIVFSYVLKEESRNRENFKEFVCIYSSRGMFS